MIWPSTWMHPGDPDGRAEAAGDPLGDAGLAVAGIAVEEHAAARVDGRAEQAEHLLGDQQVGEGPAQVGFLGVLGRDRLGGDRLEIVVERHRRRADVGALLEVDLGPRPAGVGQRIDIIVGRRRVGVGEDLLVLELAEEVGERAERQAQLGGDPPAGGHADIRPGT